MPLSDSVNDRRNLLAQILTMQAMQQQPMPNEVYGEQLPGNFTRMPLEYYDPKDHSPTSGYSPGMFESSTNPVDFADMTMGQTMNPGDFADKSTSSPSMAISTPGGGNLFSSEGFDAFGNPADPDQMGSPAGTGQPGSFGSTVPGSFAPDTFSASPIGGYTTSTTSPYGWGDIIDTPSPTTPGTPTDFNPAASGDMASLGMGGLGMGGLGGGGYGGGGDFGGIGAVGGMDTSGSGSSESGSSGVG